MPRGIIQRAEEGFLMWFGHVERMERDWLILRVYKYEVEDERTDVILGMIGGRGYRRL